MQTPATSPPPPPASASQLPAVIFAKRALIWVLLTAMLFLVLLPLFWMILTAFRARGTAFSLTFLPRTELVYPSAGADALTVPVPDPDAGLRYVHLEFQDTGATTVVARELLPGGETRDHEMGRVFDGLWVTDVPVDEDRRTFSYKFVVNGETETEDPRAQKPAEEGWHTLELTEAFTTVGEPELRMVAESGYLNVRLSSSRTSVSLDIGAREEVQLEQAGPGIWAGTEVVVGPEPLQVRIIERRDFGEALGALYTVNNFRTILSSENFNFARYFMNSLIVATSAGILTVLICTMAAFAFAQKRFYFRDKLFAILLASMLVPGMIYMVPQFSITLKLGWLNSFQGMVVPHLGNVFGLFLLKQYISQIPKDLFNAAEIDGANNYRVFTNVVTPVCLPIMVTLFLLTFVTQWSNFLWQLIVNTGDQLTMTLPVGLQQFKGQNANDWELIMAGACFSIIPIAILFLSMQKYFLSGLTAGAVKE